MCCKQVVATSHSIVTSSRHFTCVATRSTDTAAVNHVHATPSHLLRSAPPTVTSPDETDTAADMVVIVATAESVSGCYRARCFTEVETVARSCICQYRVIDESRHNDGKNTVTTASRRDTYSCHCAIFSCFVCCSS